MARTLPSGHHEATYQHALLVTGVLVDFGISLRNASDRSRESSTWQRCCTDIGKAKILIDILDKPGRLADAERAIIELHPVIAFEALKRNSACSSRKFSTLFAIITKYLDGIFGIRIDCRGADQRYYCRCE
ncbi:MAG: hypothetical protein MZV49_27270 [Rhodopseudomonas palustris]|nr:hypothetical protein [Rhodopseudomonas palustris]